MLRVFLCALLLVALLGPAARAQEAAAVDLAGGLKARLVGPGEVELAGPDGKVLVRLRLALEASDGRLRRLDAEVLGPGLAADEALPGRPAHTAGEQIAARSLGWGPDDARRRLRAELYHWPWFHVDGAAFLLARLEGPEKGRPVAQVDSAEPAWRRATVTLDLHGSLGPDRRRAAEVLTTRIQDARGRPLHLALLALDGGRPESPGRLLWPAHAPTRWVLALVAAPSEAALRRALGQAWMAQENTSKNIDKSGPVLGLPPICQRCRAARASSAEVELSAPDDQTLQLRLRLRGLEGHGALDAQAAELAGVALGPWLASSQRGEAVYRLPAGGTPARHLEAAAATGSLQARLRLDTGVELQPDPVEIRVDPALARRQASEEARELLPGHLAPRLLESWPNPFQDRTTILYRVPATVGEAFDFAQGAPRGLQLSAPPPFGTEPTVRVKVYSVSGKLVRLLSEEARRPGEYQVDWDGSDEQGRPVAAGAYYVLVEMGDYQVTRRVLRLRS